jgi:hypothetical protein
LLFDWLSTANIAKIMNTYLSFLLFLSRTQVLRLQIETSKRGGRRYLPYCFTEQGVAMLSGLLNSDIAIDVNINIMRAFVAVRTYLNEHASTSKDISDLKERVRALEKASNENITAINDMGEDIQNSLDDIYIALSELANKQKTISEASCKPRRPIGYIQPKEDK